MNRRFLWIATFMLFISILVVRENFTASSFVKSEFRQFAPTIFFSRGLVKILPVGDSLTAGSIFFPGGLREFGGYRYPLWKILKDQGLSVHFMGGQVDGPRDFAEPFHEGHIGIRTDQLLLRLPAILAKWNPDMILLWIGTNDVVQGVSILKIKENILKIVELINRSAPNCEILVSGPIPNRRQQWTETIVQLNALLQDSIRAENGRIHWVDLGKEGGLDPLGDDFSDDIHLTEKGYTKIATAWSLAMMKLIQSANKK